MTAQHNAPLSVTASFSQAMGSNAINVYSPSHALIANRTITSNISKPAAIAIDGVDNLYVNEDYAAVGLYSFQGSYQMDVPLSPALGAVNAMSARGPYFDIGGGGLVTFTPTELMLGIIAFNLTNYVIPITGVPVNDALGVATDGNHNVYEATDDPAIVFVNTQAVDSINNHVFVADLYGNDYWSVERLIVAARAISGSSLLLARRYSARASSRLP